MSRSEIVLYALGGGSGHAVRACSLARALERRGTSAVVLLPDDKLPLAERLGARAWPLARSERQGALRARVERALSRLAPAHLVVDALPDGVLGELAPLPPVPRTTLLLRLHRRVDARSVNAFDDVFDLEPHLAWRPPGLPASSFAPVARAPASRGTSVDVALYAGTDAGLRGFFERLSRRLRSHGYNVALVEGQPRIPDALDGLSPHVVVGAAGYNLVYEAARAGAWHVAIPRPRAFDDQRRRAQAVAEIAESPDDVEARVLARLDDGERPQSVEIASFDALAARVLEGEGPGVSP